MTMPHIFANVISPIPVSFLDDNFAAINVNGYEVDALISYGGGSDYTAATITAALAAIGTSQEATLLIRPGTWVVSSNVDWSAYTNVVFKISPGAILSHGSYTMNIPNPDAFPLRWLTGSGVVTFSGMVYFIHPEWWTKNTSGSTDMRTALQAAIDSVTGDEGNIYLQPGVTYLLSSALDTIHLLKIKSNVSICGRGIIKVGNGMLSSTQGLGVLYSADVPVSNVHLQDFTIDFNAANNLWTSGKSTVSRVGCAYGGSDFTIKGVTFKNAPGAHFVYISDNGLVGISTSVGYNKASVKDCWFLGCGKAITGNQITDHSSVYLDANHGDVAGNHFIQPNLSDIYSTAYEIHGSDVEAYGNETYGYAKECNIAAQMRDTTHVTCHGNTAREVVIGYCLWAGLASPYKPDAVLSHVKIAGNIIGLRDYSVGGYRLNAYGLLADDTTMASTVNGHHISFEHNDVYMGTINDNSLQSSGVYAYRLDDLTVESNKFTNFSGEAVYVLAEVGRDLKNVKVAHNTEIDCGISSESSVKRAMAFLAQGYFINLSVYDNDIVCGAGIGTVAVNGILFGTGGSGGFTNLTLSNPNIAGMSGLAIAGAPVGAGGWVAVPYSAGDFTGSGTLAWTVESGDLVYLSYLIKDQTMTVSWLIQATTVSGTGTILYIAIPGGKVVKTNTWAMVPILAEDNAISLPAAVAWVDGGATKINIQTALAPANWTASTNQTRVAGQITFEIE